MRFDVSGVPVPARVGVVVLVGLVLQLSLVARGQLFGVAGDVMVVIAVAAGFHAGPDKGAIIGFATGLAVDLVLTTPLGLTALVFAGVSYASGLFAANLIRAMPLAVVALSAVAAPAAVAVWVLLGVVFGQDHLLDAPLLPILLVASLVAALAAPIVSPVVRWATADPLARVRR